MWPTLATSACSRSSCKSVLGLEYPYYLLGVPHSACDGHAHVGVYLEDLPDHVRAYECSHRRPAVSRQDYAVAADQSDRGRSL